MHLVCDSSGIPLAAHLSAGQRHEASQCILLLQSITIKQRAKRSRKRPQVLVADKGFDSKKIRSYLRTRGIASVIPEKKPRGKRRRKGRKPKFDKQLYKERNIIERLINWLKDNRRLATRYDKLASSFLVFVKLAFLTRYFKKLFSDRP